MISSAEIIHRPEAFRKRGPSPTQHQNIATPITTNRSSTVKENLIAHHDGAIDLEGYPHWPQWMGHQFGYLHGEPKHAPLR